jgi:hypothetical protein
MHFAGQREDAVVLYEAGVLGGPAAEAQARGAS